MDRNTKIKACWSRSPDKDKSVNKIHTKVIKHFQPTMQLHVNDAELPFVGVAQDDSYKPCNVTETCPTRVRTAINKTKPRAISKQHPSNFHHSSTSTYSKHSKLRRCTKKSSMSTKGRSSKEFDSASYMNELKKEINEFKAFQTSLTKTADSLKSEIKEFRNSTNTNITTTKLIDENQTTLSDVVRKYINLDFKNSGDNLISDDKSSSCKELHLSCSFSKDKPSSTSEQSSSSSLPNEKSSVLKIIPWILNIKNDTSNFIFDEKSLPEPPNENNKKLLFVNDSVPISKPCPSNNVSSFKETEISASAGPPLIPKINYSEPSHPKPVKCDRLKKDVLDTNSKYLETDADTHIQENKLLQITTKTRLSKYRHNAKVVKRNNNSKTIHKGKEALSGPATKSPAYCERALVKHAPEDKASCQACIKRNDEYVEILEQQKNQMKVFSDVIDKAQNVIALMKGNSKTRTIPTPAVDRVYKVYNVSTQANAFNSKKDEKQNTDSIQRDDKETNTAVSYETNEILNQDESVQVKSPQENKLIGTIREQPGPEKKLSTHLLPSVAIARELVTQKIPSVNITASDSAPSINAENSNLGYEIIKHNSDDQLQKMINIIRNMRKKDQESQMTNERSGVEQNVSPKSVNNEATKKSQTETEKELVSKNPDVHQDPTAQLMWKSYQVYKHHKEPHDLALPEIDSAALSLIDDDVYRTYVNPNGKGNNANSKSNRFSSEKKSDATDDQDEPSKSISSLSLNLDNNSKRSIDSILTHNRESLNEYKNTQLFDQSRDINSLYSPPQIWNRSSLEFENAHHPPNTGIFKRDSPSLSNVKLDNAVSANIKGYMAYPRRKVSTEGQKMSEQVDHKVSKLSKVSEGDFSDSTEQIIFSIDKVNIRRKSEFYENQGGKDSSFYKMIDSSSAKKTHNPKKRALHKINSDFRNYDSSNEIIVTHDVKVQTANVRRNGNSVQSTNSKESSSTHNTDESIKITHTTDSVEEIVYCSYCSKFCFGRNRHAFHDDAYEISANRSSIQYSHNIESVKTENIGQLSESRKVEKELNSFLDRKNNVIQDLLSSNGKTEISDTQDQHSKALSNEVLDGSIEHRRSVRIESGERNNYGKEDIIGFVKKSSVDFQQNKKKASTVMNVTIDESTITNNEVINGGGGDKILTQQLENESLNSNYLHSKSKQEKVDLNNIIFCHKTQNRINPNMTDECEQSDGEIINKCDCSIGEIRLCTTYPESKFLGDLYNTNKMVVGRNVRNSNWVSYVVKPFSGDKMYAPVPINDSSDSLS